MKDVTAEVIRRAREAVQAGREMLEETRAHQRRQSAELERARGETHTMAEIRSGARAPRKRKKA